MRYPDWDPRSWSEAYRDPPTNPLPVLRSALDVDRDDFLGIYEDTRAALLSDLPGAYRPSHRLGWPRSDSEVLVARHGDDDGDGLANQADPDWRQDERDEHAHDDGACDQWQEDPDRWVGVTRDPEVLEDHVDA